MNRVFAVKPGIFQPTCYMILLEQVVCMKKITSLKLHGPNYGTVMVGFVIFFQRGPGGGGDKVAELLPPPRIRGR